jgi:(Z)-2-((N-methylformamido)methylene)-5-hydroxybutyrolactone dehydrogenase
VAGTATNPDVLPSYELVVNGRREQAEGGLYETQDPYTGAPWALVPDASAADVDRAVRAARDALDGPWGEMVGSTRARLLRELGSIVARDAEELAVIESRDNGKLLREMRGQMQYLPEWYYFFAGLADKLHGEAIPSDRPNFFVYTRHEPVGVVAAIVPWNSPLLLLGWKLAPALAAGCTFVVKPSDHAAVSTLEFAAKVEEAGFPPGVFNVVTGAGPATGQALAAHPGVDKVAFTGSTETGIAVGHAAVSNLTRFSLELGGKSAQVVFADADLDAAANGIVAGVFAASGQTCMAGSRLLVHESVHDDLVARVAARCEQIVMGDPGDETTEMGPLATTAQRDKVLGLLDSAAAEGASVACGGGPAQGLGGLFVEPTVLCDVDPAMRIAREEVFGPVLCVLPFTDEDEAITLANDTPFGLAAGVWTRDIHRAHRVAHQLAAGSVWLNAYRVVAPSVPFGGYKMSGIGRENGIDAVHEFTETKAVWVETTGATRDPFRLG